MNRNITAKIVNVADRMAGKNGAGMYTLAVKLTDDTLIPAKGYSDLDTAERTMEYHHARSLRSDNWAGLVLMNDETNEIISEMEW